MQDLEVRDAGIEGVDHPGRFPAAQATVQRDVFTIVGISPEVVVVVRSLASIGFQRGWAAA
ncbi:hypothetical protein [Dactylosporangium sp. NPDC048998]|uniref:hypothetical protein n=1 Tax=Dactylosporangium sp. NPDC048998 TaxID=3363976 RepID=UPI0037146D4B